MDAKTGSDNTIFMITTQQLTWNMNPFKKSYNVSQCFKYRIERFGSPALILLTKTFLLFKTSAPTQIPTQLNELKWNMEGKKLKYIHNKFSKFC